MIEYLKNLSQITKYRKIREKNGFVKPIFINYLCTFKCSSRCIMCNIWDLYRNDPRELSNELTVEELDVILSRNKEFLSDVRHIGLTGGDPPMKKDIVGLVRAFRKHLPKAALGMQTNGLAPSLIKEKLSEILDFYPEFSLAVSIDGLKEVHDAVRGVSGAFEKAVKTIQIAKSLGIKRITTGMTLTNQNAHQIGGVAKLAADLGTEFSCFLAEESDYFQNAGQGQALSQENRQLVIDSLKKQASYHYYMDKLRRSMEYGEKRSLRCYSGHTSLVWDPYGNVKACILRDEKFGNLKEQTLKEMLFNHWAKEIKNKLKCCDCWCQCEVSSSAIIDITDVLFWFFFKCRDRMGFVRHTLGKSI